jgi:hypothetical protein
MPVDFLSDAQAARYGTYTAEPEPAQLGVYSSAPRKVVTNMCAFRSDLTIESLFAC